MRGQLAKLFLKLGMTSFGGPAGAIALMEDEVSRRRGWIPPARFAEMLAITKLLPGPVATQLAIWIGRELAGRTGGLIAGLCFILPAFGMLLALSALYAGAGALRQQLAPTFVALQAAALAVVLKTTTQLFRPYRRSAGAWAIASASFASVALAPRAEPLVILGFGLVGAWLSAPQGRTARPREAVAPLGALFWVCFKAAALTFGTGLAVLPVLQSEMVLERGWVSRDQFLDGLALGQITPGPLLITATFLGYQTAGMAGAWIATLGSFLPAFLIVLGILPVVERRLAGNPRVSGFIAWAIPSVVGAIAGASTLLAWNALHSPWAWAVFGVGLLTAFRTRMPAWALIPLAGAAAWLLSRIFVLN